MLYLAASCPLPGTRLVEVPIERQMLELVLGAGPAGILNTALFAQVGSRKAGVSRGPGEGQSECLQPML